MKIKPLEFKNTRDWSITEEWEARPTDWLVFRIKKYTSTQYKVSMFCGKWKDLYCEPKSYEEAVGIATDKYLYLVKQLIEE